MATAGTAIVTDSVPAVDSVPAGHVASPPTITVPGVPSVATATATAAAFAAATAKTPMAAVAVTVLPVPINSRPLERQKREDDNDEAYALEEFEAERATSVSTTPPLSAGVAEVPALSAMPLAVVRRRASVLDNSAVRTSQNDNASTVTVVNNASNPLDTEEGSACSEAAAFLLPSSTSVRGGIKANSNNKRGTHNGRRGGVKRLKRMKRKARRTD